MTRDATTFLCNSMVLGAMFLTVFLEIASFYYKHIYFAVSN